MISFFFYILIVLGIIEILRGRSTVQKNDNYAVYTLLVVLLILYNGLKKYSLFSDQLGYEYNLIHLDFSEGRNNIGYQLLNIVVHYIYNDYVFLSFIVSIFVFGTYSYFIKKLSPYPCFSLFIFFITNYIMAMLAVRQYISMAICISSIPFIFERKAMHYWICVIVAATFHSSALIFAPIYYLYGLEFTKRNILLISIGSIIVIFSFQILIKYIVGHVAGDYAFYLDDYESENGLGSWDRAISKLFILFVFCVALKKHSIDKGINLFTLCNMLLSFVVCAGGVGLFGVFRLKEFFLLGDVLAIPLIFKYSYRHSFFKRGMIYIGTILYIYALVKSFWGVYETNFINGYKFFWEL